MALTRRGEIGRPLTIEEVDGNFDYLEGLASAGPTGSSVQSVTGDNVDDTDPLNPIILDSRPYQVFTGILNINNLGDISTLYYYENTIGTMSVIHTSDTTILIELPVGSDYTRVWVSPIVFIGDDEQFISGPGSPPYNTTIHSRNYIRTYTQEIGNPTRIEVIISDPDYVSGNFSSIRGNIEIRLYENALT